MSHDLRLVSTLPSVTETLFELGLGNELLGVSHECNYPAGARALPRVTSVNFNYAEATSAAIDAHVARSLHEHHSLYLLNEPLMRRLAPTHLITQQLCDVCSITPTEIQAVLRDLPNPPELISLAPKSLPNILADIRRLGATLGRPREATALTSRLQRTLDGIRARTAGLNRPTVFCVEWLDPLYASGHWVPEMVAAAGGAEVLGARRTTARQLSWNNVAAADPEILILMPCGFSFAQIRRELANLARLPQWPRLRAVQRHRVWIADGPAYFNQSGPRVISGGVPLLASIIHPEIFGPPNPREAVPAGF